MNMPLHRPSDKYWIKSCDEIRLQDDPSMTRLHGCNAGLSSLPQLPNGELISWPPSSTELPISA